MPPFSQGSLQQLMREIRKTILDDIAEALHNLGFIGGTKIDAGKLVGQVPIGNARFLVQQDGAQVGEATYILNFVGAGWVITPDAANNRINIGLASAGGPSNMLTDAMEELVTDASDALYSVVV